MEKLRQTLTVRKERAILVGAILHGSSSSDGLAELTALAESAGAVVVDKFQQKIHTINPALYIGSGKAEQLADRLKRFKADVLIFDNDLSPAQIRELEKIVGAKVIDRSELILDIFATRAKTRQAKLQVELAQLEYTYPRLARMWSHLDTLAGAAGATGAGIVGGIGTRGPGEQQLETDRRLVKNRITELKRDLAGIDSRRIREIESRKGLFKICLVGYTNAGKSTLLNALTSADAVVADRLFSTLDTRTRRWILQRGEETLLSDTVGFVRNLPHQLVASFKATLEEALNADLLLHVVDVSNTNVLGQIDSVKCVLSQIGCGDKPMLSVFNKVDIVKDITELHILQTIYRDAICISAKTGLGLEQLTQAVLARYKGTELLLCVKVHPSNGRVESFLRSHGTIVAEQYSADEVIFEARLGQNQLAELERLCPAEVAVKRIEAGGQN